MSRDFADSRVTYDRFLEFERLMRAYPASPAQYYNPTPLGLCSFALTFFVYSMYNAGATVPITAYLGVAMGLALFYGGLIELLAGLAELRLGNNFYALTFCSYAGFWFGLGSLYVSGSFDFLSGYNSDTTTIYNAMGVFYLAWTIFTIAMLIASVRTNIVLVLFFFFLALTYILLTASNFLTGHQNLQRAAGAFGILTSAIAWYGGFASLLKRGDNAYFNMPVFNIARRSAANTAGAPVHTAPSQKL